MLVLICKTSRSDSSRRFDGFGSVLFAGQVLGEMPQLVILDMRIALVVCVA